MHIQWNRLDDTIEVVNYSAGHASELTAQVEILNMDGKQMAQHSAAADVAEDSTEACYRMEYPGGLSPVHFLRLALKRGSETLSTNFYWRGVFENDFRAIRDLPPVQVKAETAVQRFGDLWRLTTELRNVGSSPALMVRIKAIREKTGDRILPAIYSDNYVALMPGETTTLKTELRHADTRGEKPAIIVA